LVAVCRIENLPPGESIRIRGDVAVAVFNVDGDLFAIDDTCTHQDASLADGYLDGHVVECPLHSSCFDLRTGLPTGPPAMRPVRTHRVNVVSGVIHVHLTAGTEVA